MCHFPLTMVLSLSPSLPPPALSLYLFLSDWTSLKLFLLLFSLLTIILRSTNAFDQFFADLVLALSCVLFYRCISSSLLSSWVSSKLSTYLLCIPVDMSVKLYWWQTICANVTSLQMHWIRYHLCPPHPDLNLPTLVCLWSLHQTQLCIRVTAASFSIDPDASHLRKYQEDNWTGSQDWP